MNILFYDFAHIKSKPIIFLQLLWTKEKNQKHVKKTYIMSLNIDKNNNKLHCDMDFGPKLVHCNLH
jgi:hypothetical protein